MNQTQFDASFENTLAATPSSPELYRLIFEQAADSIFVTAPEGHIVEVNPQACRLFGYSRAEFLALPILELLPPDEVINQPIQLDKLNQGKSVQSKRRLRRKDGVLVTVEIRAQLLSDGRLLSMIRDLTEDETIEAVLRENEEWLRLAHEAADLGSWRVHLPSRKIYLDARARSHYGLTTDLVTVDQLLNCVHPADRAQVRQQGDTLRDPASPSRQTFEHRVVHADGSIHWLSIQARVYFDRADSPRQPVLIAGISQDITAQKQAERQLQEHNQQLALLAELSHLLAQSTQDYQALPEVAVHKIAAAFAGGGLIRLLSPDGEWLQSVAIFDDDPEVMALMQTILFNVPIRTDEPSLSQQILHSGKPLFIPTINAPQLRATISADFWPLLDRLHFQSVLAVPLQVRGQVIGIIYLWRTQPDTGPFHDQDLRLLQGIADRTALAISNAQLYRDLQTELAQRRQAEQALRESERRYRTLISALPVAVYTTDANGYITLYNEAATKLWGRHPQLGIDRWCGAWQHYSLDGQPLPHGQCPMAIALREDRPLSGQELMAIRPDQSRVFITAYPTPLHDDAGTLSGGLNVLVDITARKQAEAARQEIAENMAAAQRIAHFGSWEVELNEQLALNETQLWSAECCRIFGYAPGTEITTTHFRERIHPDDISMLRAAAWPNLHSGQSDTYTYRIIRPDGTVRHIQQQVTVVMDEQRKRPLKLIGTVHDVTERKTIEDALRVEQERLHYQAMLLANINDAVIATDQESRITSWNRGAEQLYGWEATEVIGKPLDTIINYEYVDILPTAVLEALTTNGVWRGATTQQRKDGTRRQIMATISLLKDSVGTVIGSVGVMHDVTQQKEAEVALRNSEERLQIALAAAHMGVWEWEEQKQQLFWSPECVTIFGITEPKTITLDLVNFVHPDDIAQVVANYEQALATQSNYTDEFRIIREDGAVRWIAILGEGTYHRQHELLRVVGTVQDITARKNVEAERAQLEEQLHQSQKMETIGRLAGGVAHDFNNLLTVIQGYSDMLLGQVGVTSPLFSKLEQISRAGKRAADLTGQLLAFSRRQMLTPTIVDLNTLVTNLQRMFERLIGEDIMLTTVLHPALWTVTVDSGRMEQVIMNLVVNARDAMPTGGVLTIATNNVHLAQQPQSSQTEALRGPCVQVTITDTGCGMEETVRTRIFEPFFTTKEQGKGTGLGLSTAYGIVKQSGGDITVDSTPKVGSIFKVYLPATPHTVQNGENTAMEALAMHGSETILLVEDEEMVRDLVQFSLEEAGYRVLAAQSGPEALALAAQHTEPIQLMVTDVVMPQMSGRELAEQFSLRYPSMKVLFTSGYTDDAVVRHGLLTAEVAFLQKPFSPHTLVAKVRALLDE